MVERRIAHYEILDELGAGGMGVVYLASDTRLERKAAIKALPEELAEDPERLARFKREAKLLASLNNPHIATVYGLEEVEGRRFLAMELVEGKSLAEMLAKGPIPVKQALELAQQIAGALEAAHRAGVIHRDVKPGNIMLDEEGKAKVLDFGLAKAITSRDPEVEPSHSPTLPLPMTQAGRILGTPVYMSPEQVAGEEASRQSDIWAFGCVLYEMLTGKRAFPVGTVGDAGKPEWEALPSATPAVARRLLRRCLARDPRRRLRDIGDAQLDLDEALSENEEKSTRPPASSSTLVISRRMWVAGVLVVAAIVAATAIWQLLPEEKVVYLIDTAAPIGVYDDETRSSGRTNADDISDILGDLPVTLVKETASPLWRREHQILVQRPALIVIFLSAFAYTPTTDGIEEFRAARAEVSELGLGDPVELGRSRLVAFLGYIALGSPHTRFVVYSRGHFRDDARRERWISQAETRFPQLRGKIVTYNVPGEPGTATFRDPATAEEVKRLVESILGLD